MRPDNSRRSVYFAFQGLLAAVLLLIFLYHREALSGWGTRLSWLAGLAVASLAYVEFAPDRWIFRWWAQAGLFVGDAALASLTLSWTHSQADFFLIYFLIILGTALARDLAQTVVVVVVTSGLYLASQWSPRAGLPATTGFWLRLLFLWISASLLAILSRDSERARREQEERYRDRLIQYERLASLGELAAEVAHRIKGPLTTILVNAEVMLHRHRDDKKTAAELSEIREEVERCKRILKDLLDLGRIEEMDRLPLDLREPLRLALKAIEPQLRGRGLAKDVRGLEGPAPVVGDASLLQEALSALLQNAVEASSAGGQVRVTLSRVARELRVEVEDGGRGIEGRDLERIFRPFFTKGKDGTGLGLSAALRILQKHGGSIDAYSGGRDRGARFTLTIPRAS